MKSSSSDRRRGHLASAAVAALLLAGCAGTGPAQPEEGPSAGASAARSSAPTPSVTTAPETPAPTPRESATPTPAADPAGTAVSAPVSVRIPAAGTDSELLHLGLRDNGSLDVPPGDPGAPAAWYTGSPAPGEVGPAVLLGHVNATDGGPGVFAGLRGLVPGDRIEVLREDGSTAVFAVERGEQYAKDAFPTLSVYGNTEGPELRLITCDGYDPATGEFDDNYVVYAQLVD
ncbi:class F sortase [Kocuria sp. SM24M-10]|uniref:class F sortase n=1 Tax=Kocuria sp. SM24M-10 TaxID=1660349 RepID=UPI0006493FB2|nr:class F sortase [Kocuria sp. SM24M-10]KLU09612.1 peptidase C60 sortase A and B [Kocuria sp. SM24M-10]